MIPNPDMHAQAHVLTDEHRHGSVASAWVAMLHRYQANRLSLLDWMHPSWLSESTHSWLIQHRPPRWAREAFAGTWLERAGCAMPPLSMFRNRYDVLAALPITDALCVMRLRALFFRRSELRYWIDRESRARMAQWLGPDVILVLRELIGAPNAPAVERLMRHHDMPALDDLSDDELAREGFCLFEYDSRVKPGGPLLLLQWAVPRNTLPPIWITQGSAELKLNESAVVLNKLPALYPEQTWLSGYDIHISERPTNPASFSASD